VAREQAQVRAGIGGAGYPRARREAHPAEVARPAWQEPPALRLQPQQGYTARDERRHRSCQHETVERDRGFVMIAVWLEQAGPWWFAVAHHEKRLVATAIGTDREGAAEAIRHCLPRGRAYQIVDEANEHPRSVVRMLARLEAGEDEVASFELCPDCVPEALAAVLRAAAAIPRGYVSSYGSIAAVAETEARVVGRVMATNPLYPIVPCHRVVGSDMSLVGYSGRQDAGALRAKLDRLRAEARGFWQEKAIEAAGGLRVYPVEWVIAKAAREGIDAGGQLSLW